MTFLINQFVLVDQTSSNPNLEIQKLKRKTTL